jgi:hypothetical protein
MIETLKVYHFVFQASVCSGFVRHRVKMKSNKREDENKAAIWATVSLILIEMSQTLFSTAIEGFIEKYITPISTSLWIYFGLGLLFAAMAYVGAKYFLENDDKLDEDNIAAATAAALI